MVLNKERVKFQFIFLNVLIFFLVLSGFNPPYFPQKEYTADIYDDRHVGFKVIEVKAEDLDTKGSLIIYSIK